jgi:L-threonylcarbamoyladenylate synthase
MKITDRKLIQIIKDGGVGVLPTDTLYGLVGSALLPETVKRIYKIKKRNPRSPFIILIDSIRDLNLFSVKLEKEAEKFLQKNWPGQISVVLPCPSKDFFYLHRGTKTLAFRLPKKDNLRNLIKKTGPLVAPSANPEGAKPAENISEAKKYLAKTVDFYIAGKKLKSLPSTLVRMERGKVSILREGAKKVKLS